MRSVAILAALLVAAVPSSAAFVGEADVPVPTTVEEARARHQYLRQQAAQVDQWVDEHWEEEFPQFYPALPRGPKRDRETAQAYREREMRTWMAIAELKARLRLERSEWIENERQALLAMEIRQPLPVRLGAYDPDRGMYPLLLGFGWPSALAVTLKVPEAKKDAFAAAFPASVPAVFRLNEKEEIYLLSVGKAGLGVEPSVLIGQAAPRLLWRNSHASWVTAVSMRPDGAQAVSGGGDGVLCSWDAETGNALWRLSDVEMAMSLAHRPGGAAIATGGTDAIVRLRDAATGKELWRAEASGMVFAVAFSPDGRFLASGDDGGALRVWNAETGKEILLADLGAPVLSVDYSRDGRSVVAGSDAGFIVLWDVVDDRQLWKIPFEGPVYSLAVSPAGGVIAAGGGGSDLRALKASDGSDAWRRKSDGEVRAVRFDPAGRLLAYGGSGYSARVVTAETGEPVWAASVGSPVRALAFGPEGKKLAVGSADFGVRLFAVDEGDRVPAAFCAFGTVYVERGAAPRLFR